MFVRPARVSALAGFLVDTNHHSSPAVCVNHKYAAVDNFVSTTYHPVMQRIRAVKNGKRRPGRPATGKTPQHQFRCPDDEWDLFEQAAKIECDASVAAWLRRVAVKAAKRVIEK